MVAIFSTLFFGQSAFAESGYSSHDSSMGASKKLGDMIRDTKVDGYRMMSHL